MYKHKPYRKTENKVRGKRVSGGPLSRSKTKVKVRQMVAGNVIGHI